MEIWGLKFSRIDHFDIICRWWTGGQNLRGKGVNIQKYWMIWHEITLLLSLLLLYYHIYVIFLLYFENQVKFRSCVWLQICSLFCNLIYCSLVGFLLSVLILSLVLQSFPTGRYGGSTPTTSRKVAPTITESHFPLGIHTHTHTHTHAYTHTHTHTHTLTLYNNFQFYNPMEAVFLAVAIAPVPFLF